MNNRDCLPAENNGISEFYDQISDNCFTIIRMLCCLIIIYEHCVRVGGLGYIDMHLSELCVDIFFILSGFWVSRSFILSNSKKNYAKKRIKKIIPPYYAVLIVTAIVFSFLCKEGAWWYWFGNVQVWKNLFFNSIFLNFLCPTLPGILVDSNISEINGSLWTLKIEVGFYITLPIIIEIIKKIRKKNVVLVLTYIFSVGYAIMMPRIGMPASLTKQLPYYLRFFSMGMFFALNGNKGQNIKVIYAAVALVITTAGFNIKIVELTIMPIALAILLFYVGFRFKCGNIKDLSYLIYLIHFPIIQIFNIIGIINNGILLIAVVVVISIAISLIGIVAEERLKGIM